MNPMRATMAALALATTLATAPARADEPPTANVVFVEVLGNCLLGSLNYERTIEQTVLVRVGAGVFPDVRISGSDGVVIEQVATVGTLVGSGRHSAELAIGATLGEPTNGGRWGAFATAVVGYRYRSDAGNVFRAGATPLVRLRSWGEGELSRFVPLFGLSFGQSW